MRAPEGAGVVVLFRSRRTADDEAGYAAMAHEMLETARTMPGYVDFRHYEGEDGERISVVYWRDEETLRAWKEHARHRLAQQLGNERWYAEWRIDVAHVVRSYGSRGPGTLGG